MYEDLYEEIEQEAKDLWGSHIAEWATGKDTGRVLCILTLLPHFLIHHMWEEGSMDQQKARDLHQKLAEYDQTLADEFVKQIDYQELLYNETHGNA